MKRFHPASPADLPGSPPGGRSGQVQVDNRAAGGAEGGFEVYLTDYPSSIVWGRDVKKEPVERIESRPRPVYSVPKQ